MLSLPAWGWYQRFKEHATVCVASCRLVLRAQSTMWVLSKGQWGLFSSACEVVDSATGSGRGGSTGGVSSAAIVRERWPYREAPHAIAGPPYHVKRMDLIHLLLQPPPKIPDTMDSMWHSLVWQASLVTEGPSLGKGFRLVSEVCRENIPSSWQLRQTSTNAHIWCTVYLFCTFSNVKRKAYIYNCPAIWWQRTLPLKSYQLLGNHVKHCHAQDRRL